MTFHKRTTDSSDQTCFKCGATLPIGYYIVGDTTKYCPQCYYQGQAENPEADNPTEVK